MVFLIVKALSLSTFTSQRGRVVAMNTKILEKHFGLQFPNEVPTVLAIAIAQHGYPEREARLRMIECGETASTIEQWIKALRDHGFFRSTLEEVRFEHDVDMEEDEDGSTWLWIKLKTELQKSENSVKHRFAVMNRVIKQNSCDSDLLYLSRSMAENFVPFSEIGWKYPWSSCKVVATLILLLVSKPGCALKRAAITPLSHMLGGCSIPSPSELERSRCPYRLSKLFEKAKADAELPSTCTALFIKVIDVEIMRNPFKSGTVRPETFTHSCIMTISKSGVYLFQAYGPLGYTLLQHIEEQDRSFPMSLVEGETWVRRFESFAMQRGGSWSEDANDAYKHCFGVDLVKLGAMAVGSQLDAYYDLRAFHFNKSLVQSNWKLLPMPNASYIECKDDKFTKKTGCKNRPDGGVKHYYIPTVTSCGNRYCNYPGMNASMRCIACKCIRYCSKVCQEVDWKKEHNKVCSSFQSMTLATNNLKRVRFIIHKT